MELLQMEPLHHRMVVFAFVEEKLSNSNNNIMPNTNVNKDNLRFLVWIFESLGFFFFFFMNVSPPIFSCQTRPISSFNSKSGSLAWCSLFQVWCLFFTTWHVLSSTTFLGFPAFFLVVLLALQLPSYPFSPSCSLGLGVRGGPPWHLPFRSSSTSFVFMDPFRFAMGNA